MTSKSSAAIHDFVHSLWWGPLKERYKLCYPSQCVQAYSKISKNRHYSILTVQTIEDGLFRKALFKKENIWFSPFQKIFYWLVQITLSLDFDPFNQKHVFNRVCVSVWWIKEINLVTENSVALKEKFTQMWKFCYNLLTIKFQILLKQSIKYSMLPYLLTRTSCHNTLKKKKKVQWGSIFVKKGYFKFFIIKCLLYV